MSKHPKLLILIGLIISGVSLWLAFRNTNLSEIGNHLSRVQYWMALPMLLTYSLFYWLKLIRWQLILRPTKQASMKQLFSPMMLGFFGNNVLPAHLGEFVRMYFGAKVLKLTNSQVLATLVLERIFDILSIVAILIIIILFGVDLSAELTSAAYIAAIGGTLFILAVVVSVVWTGLCLRIMEMALFFMPDRGRKTILEQIKLGLDSFHAIKSLPLLLGIIATSVSQWLFMGATIYIALQSVHISTDLAASFVVLVFTVFAVIVPAAPGFFGTIQLAFVISLGPFGINESDAVAASISFHLVTYFSVTLLGFYLLHRMGYKMKSLASETIASQGK
ncbi:MAG: lysylphosphatidylglycerol synthase transmembrane domain-containing protein [Thiohalomonadales bacterium]